jgi:peptidoglycan/LPS O-acetylase OafA/YrhL
MTPDTHPGPDPRDAYLASRRFGALDGLRALSAAAVVWHHAGGGGGLFERNAGVTTLFVISGFLITRMLLRERGRTGTIALGRFWARRALRIFPLYYAVLGAYVLLVARLERGTPAGASFFANLPTFLTFTSNWFVSREPGERVIFYFAWSMALQEQFYLIWPAILRVVRRRYAVAVPLAFLVTEDLARVAQGAGWLRDGLFARAIASVDSPIFLGVVVAFVLEHRRGHALARRVAGQPWSLPAAVALVLLPLALPAMPQGLHEGSIAYLVVACVLAPPAAVRIVGNPVAARIGNASLGIYLLHMLALNVVRRAVPGRGAAVVFALGLPLAVAAALASRRWFEQPFLRLRDARAAPPPPEASALLAYEAAAVRATGTADRSR